MKPALYPALLSLISFSLARAQECERGTALLCDTQKDVEWYVALFNGEEQSAINAVNYRRAESECARARDCGLYAGPGARDGEEQGKRVPDRPRSRSRG
jgi:hypothetical protein